ncbi:MAG: fatty acyl-AMP ligase [Deltaproteobacteria bacterium]|nr:fatty acyl-AMP ligase [Deltaproteobacteria bacterium]
MSTLSGATDLRALLEPSGPAPAGPRVGTLTEALEEAAHGPGGYRLLAGEKPPAELPHAEVLERAARAAAHLIHLGVRRGDRVVVMLPTSIDFLSSFFGTLMAGGIPVPVAPVPVFGSPERTLQTLAHIVRDSEARILITDSRTAAARETLTANCTTLSALVLPEQMVPPPGPGAAFPSPDPEDIALIQYTSGTTSLPKGVEVSHRALLWNVYGIGQRIQMSPADVGVSWLPLFHDMGLIGAMLTSLYWQYLLVLLPTESFLMHPRRWLQAISKQRGTLSVAPNFAYRLTTNRIDEARMEGLDLSSWRVALNGSESIDVESVGAFAQKFGRVGYDGRAMTPVYGLAENCLAVTFPPRGEAVRSLAIDRAALEGERVVRGASDGAPSASVVSCGTPLDGQRVAILDEDGQVRREGEVGEIVVGGPCVMKGYHRDEEKTARTLAGGWLHTGDLGFVLEGRLHVTGRSKELIIRRGRNYYPYDIERIAASVTGASAAAIGLENREEGTEDLVLIVESKARGDEDQAALRKQINAEVLAELGIAAERIVFCPSRSLPRTTSGKLQRSLCKRRYLDGTLPVTG